MKNNLILILKGMLIGIGKVIPGVSGSLIAISLNVYERCISIISSIFYDIKKLIILLNNKKRLALTNLKHILY